MYMTFGTPVLAPCQGKVAKVVDGHPDMTVPEMDREHMAGNYVALNCGDYFVILAHLRRGSISVATDDRVDVGDVLGEMGNSGNSSEPHLHLHAQRGLPEDAPLGGEPLWLTINGRFLVRNERVY
jgi:murein DD-endopeptidase MepM/ murein hydrolase activator NlpD